MRKGFFIGEKITPFSRNQEIGAIIDENIDTPSGEVIICMIESRLQMRRIFLLEVSQAGVFHVTILFLDWVYHFGDDHSKDQFLEIVRAYEDLLGFEILT